jgi:hypothetical protein
MNVPVAPQGRDQNSQVCLRHPGMVVERGTPPSPAQHGLTDGKL